MSEPPDDDFDFLPSPPPSKEKKKTGQLIYLPKSKTSVHTDEIGTDFVVGQGGQIPTADLVDTVEVEQDLRDRIAFVRKQELVRVAESGSPTSEMLDALIKEVSEELSHLKFDRRQASKDGKPTANFTLGRISGLRNLAEILFKRKEAALAEKLDLKSPRIKKLFTVWLEFFHSSMSKSGVSSEEMDMVFKQMKADMSEWEKRMETSE